MTGYTRISSKHQKPPRSKATKISSYKKLSKSPVFALKPQTSAKVVSKVLLAVRQKSPNFACQNKQLSTNTSLLTVQSSQQQTIITLQTTVSSKLQNKFKIQVDNLQMKWDWKGRCYWLQVQRTQKLGICVKQRVVRDTLKRPLKSLHQ